MIRRVSKMAGKGGRGKGEGGKAKGHGAAAPERGLISLVRESVGFPF